MSLQKEMFRFEVAFSYASPHCETVRAIAEIVRTRLGDGKVFFDKWFEHEIKGEEMAVLLSRFFREQSRMVVADLSVEYADRPWCQAEAKAIRAFRFELDSARDETGRLRFLHLQLGDGNLRDVLEAGESLDGVKNTPAQCAATILARHATLVTRTAAASIASPLIKGIAEPAPRILFFHAATNDDRYSRREQELAWLDECAKSFSVRVATVTGQGGLGKTSLVGHWIAEQRGWRHRAFRGVFFFSFYSNRDPQVFFTAFLKFVCEVENVPTLRNDSPVYHLAATACKKWNYLVVLDGLEVLQHGEETPARYGWIADGDLTEFVAQVGKGSASLLLLTSRFSFPRITDQFPDVARASELPLFDEAEGADLLTVCGLQGSREQLEGYSKIFGGHPLALRIFVGACRDDLFGEPEAIIAQFCSLHEVNALPDPDAAGLEETERQRRRQRRQFYQLLVWFERELAPPKLRLLQLVALFSNPVPTGTLITLVRGLGVMRGDFAADDAPYILGLAEGLRAQSLLQKEADGNSILWSAHPIVRDIFRTRVLAEREGLAQQFAEIVGGKPSPGAMTLAEAEYVVASIEVLLAAGDFVGADNLYYGRLGKGDVFRAIPAPTLGLRCAQFFTQSGARRSALEKKLGPLRVTQYLSHTALELSYLGRAAEAAEVFQSLVEKYEMTGNELERSVNFQNLAENQTLCGALTEAIENGRRAIHEAKTVTEVSGNYYGRNHQTKVRDSMAIYGHALGQRGDLSSASNCFAEADELERLNDPSDASLWGLSGIQWCRLRWMTGDMLVARQLVEAQRLLWDESAWGYDEALCDLLLGEFDLHDGNFTAATQRIVSALRVFSVTKMGKDVPDALLAMARLQRVVAIGGRGSSGVTPGATGIFLGGESALATCEQAERQAAYSGFLLKKCDALNLCAQLLREAGRGDEALAKALKAHEIAFQCNYYWGHHEALRQLRDSHRTLNNTAATREWAEAEKALGEKMAPEIAAALLTNRDHDAKMARLYPKK